MPAAISRNEWNPANGGVQRCTQGGAELRGEGERGLESELDWIAGMVAVSLLSCRKEDGVFVAMACKSARFQLRLLICKDIRGLLPSVAEKLHPVTHV
jgi:hypothetical protein